MYKRFTEILILISCIIHIESEHFEIPPVWSADSEYIRMYEIKEINEPNILLDKVYKREVYKVNNVDNDSNTSMIEEFEVCKESPPEILFKNIGYYKLDQPISPYSDTQQVTNSTEIARKTNGIIYDYEVLKNKYQNIIDMAHFEGYVFTISSTANLSVFALTNDENGIQIKNNLKGIDWDELYKYRYQTWLYYENKEKQRQDLIEKSKHKPIEENSSTTNNNSNSTNKPSNSTSTSNSTNSTNSNNKENQNTTDTSTKNKSTINPSPVDNQDQHRRLQSFPSPKVSKDESSNSQSTKSTDDGSSDKKTEQEIYYTGPPPEVPKPHLQKGYFQLMDNNKLLIFANNEYLIAYDVNKNWCFLLSEQLQYDYLFPKKEDAKEKSSSETSNKTTNDNLKNSTEKNSTPDKKESSSTNSDINSETSDQEIENSTAEEVVEPLIPDQLTVISPEYVQMSSFEEIAKINSTHFALIDKKLGIYIYQITQEKPKNFSSFSNNPSNYFLKKTAFLGKDQFGKLFQENEELNLVDITFYQNKSLLLVLDYEKGVFAFQQKLSNSSSDKMTNSSSNKSTMNEKIEEGFVLSSEMIIKKMCNLMEFSELSEELYLSCNKIYRISMKNWPKITEKTYPHPLINIREIYVEEKMDLIIMSGYSVFKVMYLDRTANYFQDDMLDKIIFDRDTVITANENHLIALRYKVEKPAIICQAQNSSLLGTHNLLLRTTAECSQNYLKNVNYTMAQNHTFDEDDICVYNVYKSIYIWEQGEVPLKPLAIVMLVFLIFICVMIIWYILIKLRMLRARHHLVYLSEEGHKTLIEEEEQKKEVSPERELQKDEIIPDSGNKKSDIEINTIEEDHNKDLYSIE